LNWPLPKTKIKPTEELYENVAMAKDMSVESVPDTLQPSPWRPTSYYQAAMRRLALPAEVPMLLL
jgi:hypothetical protein